MDNNLMMGHVGVGLPRRTVFFASATTLCVGLVGVGIGSLLGGGTVYYFFVRHKLHSIFAFQRSVRSELEGIRSEIRQLKTGQNSNLTTTNSSTNKANKKSDQQRQQQPLKSSLKEKRTVKFANGYETADDEEYVTATSEEVSDSEDEDKDSTADGDLNRYANLKGLARRVPGSENLFAVNGTTDFRTKQSSSSTNSLAEETEQFFKTLDELFEGDEESQNQAFESLKQSENKLKHSSEYWWRLAKATHMNSTSAGNAGDLELKKTYAFEAFSHAEKALEMNPNSSNVHKWFAITLGSKGEFISINEKIQNGYEFKEHIDNAIKINPNDGTLYYLQGRFCYEISQLSWIERKVASTLFSTPPSSSFEEALKHFLSAENIGKPFKDNRLYIAKCYIGIGDYGNAGNYLKLGSSLPVLTPTDKATQAEINALLHKYRRYIIN